MCVYVCVIDQSAENNWLILTYFAFLKSQHLHRGRNRSWGAGWS